MDQIMQIEVATRTKKGNAKLVGALAGLAVDTIVVAAAYAAFDDWGDPKPCPGPDACPTCPFVFSFDGKQYVRDAEVLGRATLEAAQQTDVARLGHLAEAGGEYRIRIANELREVDDIDAVRLVVADAPPGAQIVAAPDGRLLALSDPRPPRHVQDLRGRVVTRSLQATDGTVWLSSLVGRDPQRDADLRDGLVLEFERPAGADAVTLAFNLRSTAWAAHLLSEAFALHGRDLPAWRARMNADPSARAAFFKALRREGLPNVSVWDGRAWRPAGVLVNLGPWLARDQALRTPLDGLPGPTLRVRLDSSPGLWIVDSVVADFAAPPPIEVVALTPSRAVSRGLDAREALRDADGRRVVLEQGETIDVAFAAPRNRKGLSRSVFVEATGYYTPLVRTDGDPRPALFEDLVDQPGAVARWSLQLFADELALAQPAAVRP